MSFLRNCWYVAGFAESAGHTPFARTFLDEPVVIFRLADATLVALDNRCPHRLAPLDKGMVIDDTIQCPYHGLRFDRLGQCVHMPSGDVAPPRARVKSYPIVEKYELLWIWMGDPALADADLIPDFSYLVDENWGWFDIELYARGNYQLLVDNLLDLSHSEFLHPLLRSEGWTGRNKATIEQTGNTVHARHIAEGDNILPIMAGLRPDMPKVGTTLQYQRWDAPGLLRLSFEYQAEGQKMFIDGAHFLTPETATTTHYFIRGGQEVAPRDKELTAHMREGVMAVFANEDIPIIEAQQRFLGDADLLVHEPAILKTDAAGVRARRLMSKLIRIETAAEADQRQAGIV